MSDTTINYKLNVDTGDLDKGIRKIPSKAQIALDALAEIGILIINSRQDLDRLNTQFDNLFADNSQVVGEWARMRSEILSRSQSDIKGYLATFQNQLLDAGAPIDAASQWSMVLADIAANLTKINDVSDIEALQAVQKAIAGDPSALNELGVSIEGATTRYGYLFQLLDKGAEIQERGARATGSLADELASLEGEYKNARDNLAESSLGDMAENVVRGAADVGSGIFSFFNALVGPDGPVVVYGEELERSRARAEALREEIARLEDPSIHIPGMNKKRREPALAAAKRDLAEEEEKDPYLVRQRKYEALAEARKNFERASGQSKKPHRIKDLEKQIAALEADIAARERLQVEAAEARRLAEEAARNDHLAKPETTTPRSSGVAEAMSISFAEHIEAPLLKIASINAETLDVAEFSADGSTVNRPSTEDQERQDEQRIHAERLDAVNVVTETIESVSLALTEKLTAPLLELETITAQRLDILEGVSGQGIVPSPSAEGGGVVGSLISNTPGNAGGGEGVSEDEDRVKKATDDATNATNTYAQALKDLNLTMIQDGKVSLDALKQSAKQAAMTIIDNLVNTAFEDLKSAILDIEGAGQGGGGGPLGFVLSLFDGISWSAGGNIVGAGGPVALKRYAKGGIARSPHLAVFGEGSRPEAFVPLPDGRTIPVTLRTSPANDNAGMDAQGGARMSVQIINQTGQPTAQRRTKGADGHELLQVFIGEVATDIQRNGKVGQSITNTYGINRAAR